MVKKIRVIDEVKSSEDVESNTGTSEILELAKSMDWKLWEMLQIMQRLEKKLGNISIDDE